ncbi:MAG: HAD family hydrolase [Solirubrobacterales bacterium]
MSSGITHVFFDIGGVLGSNGWDREQRQRAVAHFHLDDEFERRHEEVVGEWETGRISLDEYLESVVFFRPRKFCPGDFTAFMLEQSTPDVEAIDVVRDLARERRVRLLTLNNEAEALNRHRIETFGLRDLFEAFLSSCWLGVRKPSRAIFERALGIAGVEPRAALFVDDREQNLAPAHTLGFETFLFTGAAALREELEERSLI